MQALEQRRRQEDYRRVSVGRDFLAARADIGRDLFVKPPQPPPPNKTYACVHHKEELIRALLSMNVRLERNRPVSPSAFLGLVGKQTYSVDEMLARVVACLTQQGSRLFSQILAEGSPASERVAIFLAVLQLCHDRKISVTETENDIVLELIT
jgi:segregation and condensation protein A